IGDHLAPFGVIDAFGRLAAFPEIAAAAGAAFGVEQIISAHEAVQPLIFRRRALEEFRRLGRIDAGRQLETDDAGDHGWFSLVIRAMRPVAPHATLFETSPTLPRLTGHPTRCGYAFSALALSAAILRCGWRSPATTFPA